MKAVEVIVEVIADYPHISIVSSLISGFNKVSSFLLRENEQLSFFLSNFRGLDTEHLMHANSSSLFQIGEVFAITLLNNSSLE